MRVSGTEEVMSVSVVPKNDAEGIFNVLIIVIVCSPEGHALREENMTGSNGRFNFGTRVSHVGAQASPANHAR